MDYFHDVMNIFFPLISLIWLIFLVPTLIISRFFHSIVKFIYKENVAGKVVLITGASSGIGEHLAYEYAKRGACLVLTARRESRLQNVADKALQLGSPEVVAIRADVSKVGDCKKQIDEAVKHFGRLDHLVNNAGILSIGNIEDPTNFSEFTSVMETNFWGSVYTTHYAIPHLRKSKGKIIVNASIAGWTPTPKLSIYNASKAALISFYETLRVELGADIGITIVAPGLVSSEMTKDEYMIKVRQVISAKRCAKAIVNSACRGDTYLTEPSWFKMLPVWKLVFPEATEQLCRWLSQ
ncbi:Short-chain dehydrogenase/reductase SDR [Dillenia turbinata]|uniref:Short-chain dehydrogenase/reductase SDR n=1 Tax=Dillenia turbinata TaxID=194707 RepID=A0AAN8UR83_9MAGN